MSEQSNIYDRCRKRLTQKPDLKNLGQSFWLKVYLNSSGFKADFKFQFLLPVGFPNDFSSNMPVYYVKGGIP